MGGFAWRSPRRMLVAIALLIITAGGALAQEKVGISSAVNPQANGTPPGGTSRQLIIGQDVVFNERIATTAEGQTQLLFLDESSMSVGPNSDLTIDQFVYDPKRGSGKLAMSATRGLLRYVGGKLSKQDNAVTLKTSTATLAVRGGAFIVSITSGGQTQVIFLYGNALTVSGINGVVQSITRPGFEVSISPAGNISTPQPASSQQLAQFTGSLDGRSGGSGGASVVPTDSVVTTVSAPLTQTLQQSLEQVINTSFPPQVNVNSVQTSVNPQPNTAPQLITCATISSCSTSVSVGTFPSSTTPSTPTPAMTTTGFAGVANSTNGAGTSSGFTNPNTTFANGSLTFPQGSPQQGVFSGTFGSLGALSFPLVPGSASFGPVGTSSSFGTFSGTSFLSSDGRYFYAEITPTNQPSQRLYVSGGLPVSSSFYSPVTGAGDRPNVSPVTGMNTNTRIFAFTVRPDAALQSPTPFVPNQLGGIVPNSTVSPFYVVAPGTAPIGSTSTNAAARGLLASVAINGQGANQQSAIAVTAGTIGTLQSSGQPIFTGQMVGSSMQSANGTPTTLSSGVSSAVDANGNSFYGSNSISGFTLTSTGYGTASTGNVGSPTGSTATATSLSGATTAYGFDQPAIAANVPTQNGAEVGTNRTSQTLSGSIGGLMYTNAQSTPYAVTGGAIVNTDAPNNRVQATLIGNPQTAVSGVTSLTMQYGGLTGNTANQAFVDNNNFGATGQGNTQQITVNGATANPTGQLYFVSSGAAGAPTQLLPAGASFCQCQYLQWGYWGGSLSTPVPGSPTPRIDAGNINFWTAGSPTSIADLSALTRLGATATYTGAAIGSVFNNGASYVAAGGFNGTYNFGTQSGTFAINNFDGRNVAASGPAPLSGPNYTFAVSQAGVTGKVNGTFYGPKAAETGGSFAFQSTIGPTYIASGVFNGKR